MGVRGRLSVWRRQIPQNSGGNEGEAELKKNFEGERINRKEKETVLWKKEQTTADPERTNNFWLTKLGQVCRVFSWCTTLSSVVSC